VADGLRYCTSNAEGGKVGATGLSANPTEYRARLREQPDQQLDAWAAELMRDVAKRRGVIKVVSDVQRVARLDEKGFRRVFARGGGAPQTVGRDAEGHLMVPAISLHFLVAGLRAEAPDARERLIAYLVASFDEIVYV
jgi:hypothetical protein